MTPALARQPLSLWLAVGWIGFILLPWYVLEEGFWSTSWLTSYPDAAVAPAILQASQYGRFWLWPFLLVLIPPLFVLGRPRNEARAGKVLVASGAFGIAWILVQGFAIGLRGWNATWLTDLFGSLPSGQQGIGYGALLVAISCLFLFTTGLARQGIMRGDSFVTGAIGFVIASILLFVFFPVTKVLLGAAQTTAGEFAPTLFFIRLVSSDIWNLNCLADKGHCGVLWTSFSLAVSCGLLTTLLGLAFALLAQRTNFPAKALLRLLTVLPIITPPFVIGLGIILLLGRNGMVTLLLNQWFGIPPTRWIYGFSGLLLVQVLAFTPIAFLLLTGVVQGISPSMEEAAQTLRASRWRTFITVTWPLLRPGLANAFLIGFVESLADFGNPLVLGGNFEVLATQIFYAVVGSQNDPGRASALSITLLILTLSAFFLQRRWLGRKSYTTLAGKGDSGLHAKLPRRIVWIIYSTTIPWVVFTLGLYGLIIYGGFAESLGRNNSFTFRHYITTFGIAWGEHGVVWTGRAWSSFFTTIEISALAAPLTAGIGLLTAYLLSRQNFFGKASFEFITLLSFAIPGTVIGIGYILAFNVPPIEMTGTGIILVICFVFRNMPVSIRAGIAAMSQIDKSLDECSLTLRHGSFATVRRVILPLLRPAVVAALVYSFVRAITSISAVIFLVSAEYNLATTYIVGRVEVSDFGVAIAYSSALIIFMALGISFIQLIVGERKLGRRTPTALRERFT